MKKVININFQGQVIAIEETAYELLKIYIEQLKEYFSRQADGNEIVNDIENRIAELFGNRLKLGIPCITDEDVTSIIERIGKPENLDEYSEDDTYSSFGEKKTTADIPPTPPQEPRTLYRNSNDKILGGVCSGIAHYFKTDPVWIRLLFLVLFSVGFWVYIVMWIILKPKNLPTNITKRFYRSPVDRMISGVCGGIGTYFNIQSWIPRLLFIAPFFLVILNNISLPNIFNPFNIFENGIAFPHFGFGYFSTPLLYIIISIITPKANSFKQRLEMVGEEKFIQSLRETVSENAAQVKNKTDLEDESVSANISPTPPPSPAYISDNLPRREPKGCLNALFVFFKIIFFFFVGILGIVIVSVLFGALVSGIALLPLKNLFIDGGLENTLLILSAILLIGIPILAIIIWSLRRSMKKQTSPVLRTTFIILWVMGIFTSGYLCVKMIQKYSFESSTEKVFAMSTFKGDTLTLKMQPYKEDFYTYENSFIKLGNLDGLPNYTINKDSLLFNYISLKVVVSSDSLFHVKSISSISERDLKMAKNRMQEYTFPLVQKDSILYIPEYFSTPMKQGFKNQHMVVEIAVPKNKHVNVTGDLERYKDNNIPSIIRRKYKYKQAWEEDLDNESVEDSVSVDE